MKLDILNLDKQSGQEICESDLDEVFDSSTLWWIPIFSCMLSYLFLLMIFSSMFCVQLLYQGYIPITFIPLVRSSVRNRPAFAVYSEVDLPYPLYMDSTLPAGSDSNVVQAWTCKVYVPLKSLNESSFIFDNFGFLGMSWRNRCFIQFENCL